MQRRRCPHALPSSGMQPGFSSSRLGVKNTQACTSRAVETQRYGAIPGYHSYFILHHRTLLYATALAPFYRAY